MTRPRGSAYEPGSSTVAAATREVLGELSPAERKVGRALLADYPVAGLAPVAELGAAAGVSAPTVLRFATRLGFAAYADFQAALKREISEELGSPVRRRASGDDGRLERHDPGHDPLVVAPRGSRVPRLLAVALGGGVAILDRALTDIEAGRFDDRLLDGYAGW